MRTFGRSHEPGTRDRMLVGVSEYIVADGDETLVAYGLGACVAVALYDPEAGVGGLAHAMLPRRSADAAGAEGKFVDAAVQAMLREMIEAGAGYAAVEGRLVGGADIFELEGLAKGMGERNVTVAREELEKLDVPVVAEAVGGDFGRTVEFDTATGELVVRTADDEATTL